MLKNRVIPCLLLKNNGLVKTVKFNDPRYVGDPINAVNIFNEKEVDELVLLDITATVENKRPNLKVIADIASECFMPLGYGGGVKSLADIKEILALGVEKIVINSQAAAEPDFIKAAADSFGSQSIVVSIDVKKNLWGKYEVYAVGGKKNTGREPVDYARQIEVLGAGEILLNSIDRDGMAQGYDVKLIRSVTAAVNIPVIAAGGAGKIEDFGAAIKEGRASAVSAGTMFVFQGKHRAVLISYPSIGELENVLGEA